MTLNLQVVISCITTYQKIFKGRESVHLGWRAPWCTTPLGIRNNNNSGTRLVSLERASFAWYSWQVSLTCDQKLRSYVCLKLFFQNIIQICKVDRQIRGVYPQIMPNTLKNKWRQISRVDKVKQIIVSNSSTTFFSTQHWNVEVWEIV